MLQNDEHNIAQIKHNYKLVIAAIIFFAVGFFLIIFSYYSNKVEPGNMLAFLFLNLGSLSVIGASYNLVSDLLLKKNFAKQIRYSIDQKLEEISLDETIANFGLHCIQPIYSNESLIKRISSSSYVFMILMRSNGFFSVYCPELKERIEKHNLHLTIIMLNPSSSAMSLLKTKFGETTEEQLTERSKTVINKFIKERIYDKLSEKLRENLKVRLFDCYPVYSCYVFDSSEVWLVPYFFRSQKRPVPVFVLKGREILETSEIYKDMQAMIDDISIPHDLTNEI